MTKTRKNKRTKAQRLEAQQELQVREQQALQAKELFERGPSLARDLRVTNARLQALICDYLIFRDEAVSIGVDVADYPPLSALVDQVALAVAIEGPAA